MSRIKYFETITNSRGDSLANYRVQVVDSAGAIVAIYQDEAGTRFQDAAGNFSNDNGVHEFIYDYMNAFGDGQVRSGGVEVHFYHSVQWPF